MLSKRNSYVAIKELLNNNIQYNCYYISASELKKITNLSTKQIDDILLKSGNIPISKHKKGIKTYYVFPIEIIIAYYFEGEAEILSNMENNLTQATE